MTCTATVQLFPSNVASSSDRILLNSGEAGKLRGIPLGTGVCTLQLPFPTASRASVSPSRRCSALPGLQLASRGPSLQPRAARRPARGSAGVPPAARPGRYCPARCPSAHSRGEAAAASRRLLSGLSSTAAPAAASTTSSCGRLPRPPVAPRPIRRSASHRRPHPRLPAPAPSGFPALPAALRPLHGRSPPAGDAGGGAAGGHFRV